MIWLFNLQVVVFCVTLQAARNCLITDNDVVKVTDFSLSIFTSDRKPAKTCFPIKWSAPEVLTDGSASTKSDVWSYGQYIILFVTERMFLCHILLGGIKCMHILM